MAAGEAEEERSITHAHRRNTEAAESQECSKGAADTY